MSVERKIGFSRRSAVLGIVSAAPAAIALLSLVLPFGRRGVAQSTNAFTPEMFGARGDGKTNDTAALVRLAEAVNTAGGGVISFASGKTYIVGVQSPPTDPRSRYSFEPHDVLVLRGCTRPVTIRGNGARLKCAPGLRYGTFDRTGRRTENPMPYTGGGERATPYRHMIRIEECSGPIELTDLEMDGSVGELIIGGPYGDKGRQIAATGLALRNNSGPEMIGNLYTHHHGLDGVLIDGLSNPPVGIVRELVDIRSEYNGRQGCSIVGGRGYRFRNCRFNHTGRAGIFSPPGAGVDIEAEGGKTNRDFRFTDCEFANNRGVGMVADTGDSAGAVYERCRFVATTSWGAWPKKPRFRFHDCTFVGPIVQCFRDENPELATQFHACEFLDDPKLSPTGEVRAAGPNAPIANLGAGDLNVLFSNCNFTLTDKLVLPWTRQAIYANCRLRQSSPKRALPRGTYVGSNSIVGNVKLTGSRVLGTLVVNGITYDGRGSDEGLLISADTVTP